MPRLSGGAAVRLEPHIRPTNFACPDAAQDLTERVTVKKKIFTESGTLESALSRFSAGCNRKAENRPDAAREHRLEMTARPPDEAQEIESSMALNICRMVLQA
jgi:hypothetical protein